MVVSPMVHPKFSNVAMASEDVRPKNTSVSSLSPMVSISEEVFSIGLSDVRRLE